MRNPLPAKPLTTGIGSLPHPNIDSALQFSFKTDIPFLPQIPIRNPWEYMIAQALEGVPGLQIEKDGAVLLDLDVWLGRSRAFQEKLDSAFASKDPDAFSAFEPSNAASSSWQPFLWELEEGKKQIAKIQLAGPVTSQWVLRLKDGSSAEKQPEIGDQIFRLVLARAIAMSRRLVQAGITPILFWDEPGLFAFQRQNPKHLLAVQQLKLVVQALQKEGVWVGLHCCSDGDWETILNLGLDILSIDTKLSLPSLLKSQPHFEKFLSGGGKMSFGIIPTDREDHWTGLSARQLVQELRTDLEKTLGKNAEKVLSSSLYTPACGLALTDPNDAEQIADLLKQLPALVG